MGSFSIWHWIVVLLLVGIPLLVLVLIIQLIARALRHQRSPDYHAPMPHTPLPTSLQAESRLQALTELRSKGLITDVEFERKRTEILDSV
jgi:hypothetical protein